MIHIIKVNIIYLIWYPNYMEFNANCWHQIFFTNNIVHKIFEESN